MRVHGPQAVYHYVAT